MGKAKGRFVRSLYFEKQTNTWMNINKYLDEYKKYEMLKPNCQKSNAWNNQDSSSYYGSSNYSFLSNHLKKKKKGEYTINEINLLYHFKQITSKDMATLSNNVDCLRFNFSINGE